MGDMPCLLYTSTATAKALTYYVNEGVLNPVGKEYIFSELVHPVYNRNGNQVTASLAVKYLDNQTMTCLLYTS